jgi:cytochrome c oxidase subunit 2
MLQTLQYLKSWIPFMPPTASTFADPVDSLYFYLTAITLFFTVLISLAIVVFAVKYRRRSDTEVPEPIHGSMILEVSWSVIPFLITMTIFVWGAVVFFDQTRPPKDSTEIFVVGKQWMWKIQHPSGRREINELHVPVGRRIKLVMTTEDVIHDFYIPAFRTKMDVVPGRYTQLWFQATQPGKYHLFCAEYCGQNHSGMGGYVYAMEPAEYDRWLAGDSGSLAPADAGRELFTNALGCASCHGDKGQGGRGPALTGLLGTQVQFSNAPSQIADEAYIRESILNPTAKIVTGYQPIMPTFQGQVTEEQLMQLTAFIRSLSASATPGASPTPAAATPAATPAAAPAASPRPAASTTPRAPGR